MVGFVCRSGAVGRSGNGRAAVRVRMTADAALDAVAEAFGKGVRGEWIGHECSFEGATGKLQGLPDGYVPEEFLNWGVNPVGFESNHSNTLRGTTLFRKHIRIIPTVDHFSDHTDVEEEVFQHDITKPDFRYFDCGSYVKASEKVFKREKRLDPVPRIELCLRGDEDNPDYRVTSVMRFDFGTGKLMKDLQVFHEKWDMDFANGQFIEGGSGYRKAWGLHAFTTKHESGAMEIELGWMVSNNNRLAMRVNYNDDGDLVRMLKITETRKA